MADAAPDADPVADPNADPHADPHAGPHADPHAVPDTAPGNKKQKYTQTFTIALQTTYRHVDQWSFHEIKRLRRCKSSPDLEILIQVACARPPTPSFMKDFIQWI